MKKKIAVIGSGVSGLSAAWALRDCADVTVFEKDDRLGGHAHTVDISHTGSELSVDVGFIVCNPLNYPNFMKFLGVLGVETVESDMSFAVSDPRGFEWSSNKSGIFAKKRNIINPVYIAFLLEILKFNKNAIAAVSEDRFEHDLTLGDFLNDLGLSETFRTNYILPMGAAIWSTPEANMLDYPARDFLTFFNNHKLLHMDRPKWRTVAGGSRTYVQAIADALGPRLKVNSEVQEITKSGDDILVHLNGTSERFDHVITACSAPITKSLLGAGFEQQSGVLSGVETVSNRAVLHSDPSLMPARKPAWASWNVLKAGDDKVTLTYWMNKLQALPEDKPTFVTLNPANPPDPSKVFAEYEFEHPLFNMASARAVDAIESINGLDNLWMSGAWLGHGFHEDGLKSGLRIAAHLGATIPWQLVDVPEFTGTPPSSLSSELTTLEVAAQ